MEINYCLSCSEALNSENSTIPQDSESMEVIFFENLNKQKIITKLCDSEEAAILCKSCKFTFQSTLEKQISEAEDYIRTLDQSIQTAKFLITDLQSLKTPEESALDLQNSLIEKESVQVRAQIDKYEEEIEKLDKNIAELNKMQIEAIYNMMGRADHFLELETRGKVMQDEVEFLGKKHLLLRVFDIGVKDKIGSINGMRFGRIEGVMTPWSEINAAWGQCAFLLYTLYQIGGFKSGGINLYPLGAQSRISSRKNDDERFELFFSDCNYTNLIVRFNKAQGLFLEMVKEYEVWFRNGGVPYNIEGGMIGGLSICFDPRSKERWSQALRFLLQDLNYFLHKVI